VGLIVEEKLAGGRAGLDGKGGEGVVFIVELEHAAKVDGADDVYIVEKEGLGRRVARLLQEKPSCFFQTAASVEQKIVFAGDFDAHAEIVVGFDVVSDHIGKVMDVDDDFVDAEGAKAREGDFEESAAIDFDEGFWTGVGERAQARAEAGGEDHGFHDKTGDER